MKIQYTMQILNVNRISSIKNQLVKSFPSRDKGNAVAELIKLNVMACLKIADILLVIKLAGTALCSIRDKHYCYVWKKDLGDVHK